MIGQHKDGAAPAGLNGEKGQLNPFTAEQSIGLVVILLRVDPEGEAGRVGVGQGDGLLQCGQTVPAQAVPGGGEEHGAQGEHDGQYYGHVDEDEFPAQSADHAFFPTSRW